MYDQILQGSLEMQESFLFINGEFWGMYVITEKYSEDYFSRHYNLPDDDIVYTTNDVSEDSSQDIVDIFNFMDSYSLKDYNDAFNEYKKFIFIIHKISQLLSKGYFVEKQNYEKFTKKFTWSWWSTKHFFGSIRS